MLLIQLDGMNNLTLCYNFNGGLDIYVEIMDEA